MVDLRVSRDGRIFLGVTVDPVILRGDRVLLVRRAKEPYRGCWVLPGGFVDSEETCEESVVREAYEETGLTVRIVSLVGVYSGLERDPRGRVFGAAYLCREEGEKEPVLCDEATEYGFFSEKQAGELELGFDHGLVLRDVFALLKRKS